MSKASVSCTAVAFAALFAAAAPTGPTSAADIAGNDGWLPITEAVERYHLDPSVIDMLLDGGAGITCRRKWDDGSDRNSTENGWFLNGITDGVFAPAHFIYQKATGTNVRTNRHEAFDDCYATLNRETSAGDDFQKVAIESDASTYLLGSAEPMSSLLTDRAFFPLAQHFVSDVRNGRFVPKPIHVDPVLALSYRPGDYVYVVASGRRASQTPLDKGGYPLVMQEGRIKKAFAPKPDRPGFIISDIDFFPGDSGSLVLVRDPKDPFQLRAIGMLNGGQEIEDENFVPIDGLPFDEKENAAGIVVMVPQFFDLVDGSGTHVSKVPDGYGRTP